MSSPDISDSPSKTKAVVPALVFDGVTVVDVEHGRLIPSQRVVIVGTRIQSMGSMNTVQAPKEAQIVDAWGKYLIPGLWDMHFHSHRVRGRTHSSHQLLLANGVTGIRDAASEWPLDSLIAWRRQVLVGTRAGPPRQVLSGHSIDQSRTCSRYKYTIIAPNHICVADSADAMHLIDSLKAAGADMLKMYALDDTMYFIIAAKARRMGLPFGGHKNWGSDLQASDSGASIIDHWGSELMQSCVLGKARSAEKCRPVAERFTRNNTWFVPTWSIGTLRVKGHSRTDAIYKEFDQFVNDFLRADSVAPVAKRLPEYLQRGFLVRNAPQERSMFGDIPQTSATIDSVGYLDAAKLAGLPILAGTDAGVDAGAERLIAGFSIHLEMAVYVAEGMTSLDALRTATLNPARFLRGTDSLGTVAPGKVADLVLLDANPLAEITNTAAIRAVVANGRYWDRSMLDSVVTEARSKGKPSNSR